MLGTFGTYYRDERQPTTHEVEAVRTLAGVAARVLDLGDPSKGAPGCVCPQRGASRFTNFCTRRPVPTSAVYRLPRESMASAWRKMNWPA